MCANFFARTFTRCLCSQRETIFLVTLAKNDSTAFAMQKTVGKCVLSLLEDIRHVFPRNTLVNDEIASVRHPGGARRVLQELLALPGGHLESLLRHEERTLLYVPMFQRIKMFRMYQEFDQEEERKHFWGALDKLIRLVMLMTVENVELLDPFVEQILGMSTGQRDEFMSTLRNDFSNPVQGIMRLGAQYPEIKGFMDKLSNQEPGKVMGTLNKILTTRGRGTGTATEGKEGAPASESAPSGVDFKTTSLPQTLSTELSSTSQDPLTLSMNMPNLGIMQLPVRGPTPDLPGLGVARGEDGSATEAQTGGVTEAQAGGVTEAQTGDVTEAQTGAKTAATEVVTEAQREAKTAATEVVTEAQTGDVTEAQPEAKRATTEIATVARREAEEEGDAGYNDHGHNTYETYMTDLLARATATGMGEELSRDEVHVPTRAA